MTHSFPTRRSSDLANGGYGAHLDVGDTMGAFGYRLNGVAAHLDTGIDYSQGSRYVASGTFDFKPTDRLTITADVEYFEKSIVSRSEEQTSELQSLMRI